MGHKTKIMYLENKGGSHVELWGVQVPSGGELTGSGRIGRVTFSKTGKSLRYDGKTFNRFQGFKSNYVCAETGESYWISGPKKRGGDALYSTNIPTKIDDDVRVEYWSSIRNSPDKAKESETL